MKTSDAFRKKQQTIGPMPIDRQWARRRLAFFATAVAIVLHTTACAAPEKSSETLKGSDTAREQVSRIANATESAEELIALKERFKFKQDEIYADKGWYTHVHQTASNSWNRSYLTVNVDADGARYLASEYFGDDWIFHTQALVRVGEMVLTTAAIPIFSSSHHTSNSSGSVWETNHYTGSQDNGIIEAIAAASTDEKIIVRLQGEQNSKTFQLMQKDINAIKDAVKLSNLLKRGVHRLQVYDSLLNARNAKRTAERAVKEKQDATVQSENLRDYNTRVFVNPSKTLYYCPVDALFGVVPDGTFMGEEKAVKAGAVPAYGKQCYGNK